MLQKHDRIVLTKDQAAVRLKGGDVGTIVHVHRDGEAFEVEFLALDGNTAAVATVPASQLRPVAATDLTHARVLNLAGYRLKRMSRQKPGEPPRRPGEYVERGPRGGQVPDPRQVTIERGDTPLPPTQESGRTWERVGPPRPDKQRRRKA